LGVLLKLPMFIHPHVPTMQPKDGIFFHGILEFLQSAGKVYPAIYPIFAFIFLFIQAIMLNRLINDHRMMNRPNFLPAMTYMLVTSLFSEWNFFSAPLLINTVLLIVLSGLFKIYNQPKANGTIFNIGLAIGIGSLLFFPSLTFTIWALVALMIMRPFRINEWLLCLLGITSPYYFYAVYLFIVNQWDIQKIMPYLSINMPGLKQSIWLACSALLLVIPFFIGGYYIEENLRRLLIQVRKGWSLLLLYLMVAIFIPFVNTSDTFENWVLVAIPFAAFHGCAYFYPVKNWFPLLIFWITVAFILVYQYAGPGW
ncbi:MAG: hypothetical protein M3O67_02965, partial [Bacteroidota bacterium]|nr:hypothetical protein [Bacteroidota bacterium]